MTTPRSLRDGVTRATARWRIIFVADIHAKLDGFQAGDYRFGGVSGICEAVNRVCGMDAAGHTHTEDPEQEVILCIGGDMLRRNSHRLVTDDTVKCVWDYLMELLGPSVLVFGNHDLYDFGDDFVDHLLADPASDKGCTRNIEFSAQPAGCCKDTCCWTGAEIPSLSSHTSLSFGGDHVPDLRFVGLVSLRQETGPRPIGSNDSYCVRCEYETSQACLLPSCFHRDGCLHDGAESVIPIWLAHCEPPFSKVDIEATGSYADALGWRVARGDSTVWKAAQIEPGWEFPALILKAHSHAESRHARSGWLEPGFSPAVRGRTGNEDLPAPEWVPTFCPGMDGEQIGVLDLNLENGRLGYEWQTPTVQAIPFDPPPGFFAHVSANDACLFDKPVQRFGRNPNDPSCLAYAMDLILRALISQGDHTAVPTCVLLPDRSIMAHSLAPDIPELDYFSDAGLVKLLEKHEWPHGADYDPRREARQLWQCRLDLFDLNRVFVSAAGKTLLLATTGVRKLMDGIRTAVEEPKRYFGGAAPVLPPVEPDAASFVPCHAEGTPVTGEEGMDLSMFLRVGDTTYVIAPSLDNTQTKVGTCIYELCFRDVNLTRKRFFLKFVGSLTDETFRSVMPATEKLRVWTTEFACAQLLRWGQAPNLARNVTLVREGLTAPEAVNDCLRGIHQNNGGGELPYALR